MAKRKPAGESCGPAPGADMSAPYGQRVSGDRLRRVPEYVRAWLFPPEAPELIYAEPAAVAFHPRPALLVALLAREHEAQ